MDGADAVTAAVRATANAERQAHVLEAQGNVLVAEAEAGAVSTAADAVAQTAVENAEIGVLAARMVKSLLIQRQEASTPQAA